MKRPLQPNSVGGPPSVPQALNRYAATSLGQPGVAAGVNGSEFSPALRTAGLSAMSAGAGMALQTYAKVRFGSSGYLEITANNPLLKRAGYQSLFDKVGGKGRGIRFRSRLVERAGSRSYRVLDSGEIIDLVHLESKVKGGWKVGYPRGNAFVPHSLDNGLKRFLRSTGGEFGANFALGFVLAIPELAGTWQNPYFNPEQKWTQSVVTVGGVAASAGVATWISFALAGAELGAWGGPVTFVAGTVGGVAVFVVWEIGVKPTVSWAYISLGRPDPYQEYRNLKPLESGQ